MAFGVRHNTILDEHTVVYADEPIDADLVPLFALRKGAIVVNVRRLQDLEAASEAPAFVDVSKLPPDLGNGVVRGYNPKLDPGYGESGFLRTYFDRYAVTIEANLDKDGLIAILETYST